MMAFTGGFKTFSRHWAQESAPGQSFFVWGLPKYSNFMGPRYLKPCRDFSLPLLKPVLLALHAGLEDHAIV